MRSCYLIPNRRWCCMPKEPEMEHTIFSSPVHLPISNLVMFWKGNDWDTLQLWRLTFLSSIRLCHLHAVSSSTWSHAEWKEKVLLGHRLISVSLICQICQTLRKQEDPAALRHSAVAILFCEGIEQWFWFHMGHSLPDANASGLNYSKRRLGCESWSWQDWL